MHAMTTKSCNFANEANMAVAGFGAQRAMLSESDGMPSGWWILPAVMAGTAFWAWMIYSIFF